MKMPCQSCVAKFLSANGRMPDKTEIERFERTNQGEECTKCYREWGFGVAGIPMPPDYQTIGEAMALLRL